jgi:hypothetical protein
MKTIYLIFTIVLSASIYSKAQIEIESININFDYGTTAYNGGTSYGVSSGLDMKLTENLLFSTALGFHIGAKNHKSQIGQNVDNVFLNYTIDYNTFEESHTFLDLKLMRKLLPAKMKSELNLGGGITFSHVSVEYGPLVTYSIEQMSINRELISNNELCLLFNLALDYKYKISESFQIIVGGTARVSLFKHSEISIVEKFVGTGEINPSIIGSGNFKIGLSYML